MDADRWNRIETLFEEAQARDPDERAAFLEEACEGDAALRAEVESLLDAHQAASRYFSRLSDQVEPVIASRLDEVRASSRQEAPDRIGPYRILDPLGQGGMGTVFLAERADGHFRQRVAIKLLRSGLASPDARARFLAERQILASLNHPNIARLFDGGFTDQGQPYFVLEYVEGRALDRYCDAQRLPVEARLRLFCQVGRAVHYAHQNLVVHRDLKPSNVLVTDKDRSGPQVKLLDFGIAKLLAQAEQEDAPTLVVDSRAPTTRTGARWLTPEYAAPEQVQGRTITTATDVYALGVLLYELLTGQRPYRVDGGSAYEMERAICEQEPLRPSTAVTRTGQVWQGDGRATAVTPETVSAARGTEIGRLRKRLSGDLDAVVLKALRKEANQRYASAEALVEDVERYLRGEAVRARRSTVPYRLGKMVRRHPWGVGASIGAVVLVVMFALAMAWQQGQTARERDRARHEAAKAEEVIEFLAGFFQANDPAQARGDTLTVREVLDQGTARIQDELAGQPEVQAKMLEVVGEVYRQLGAYETARPLFEQALALRRELYPEDHADLAESLHSLGSLLRNMGEYDAAEPLYRDALAMRRRLAAADPDERENVAVSLNDLGILLSQQGKYDEAEAVSREALALRRTLSDSTDEYLATGLNNLAAILYRQERYAEAAPLYEEALAIHRRLLGETHPYVAAGLNNLANLYYGMEAYEQAERYRRQGLVLDRRLYGTPHRYVAMDLSALGLVLEEQGRLEEAEAVLREALAMGRETVGARHPDVGYTLHNLGAVLRSMGRYAEAEVMARDALDVRREALGTPHPLVASTLFLLGQIRMDQAHLADAERLMRQAVAMRRETTDPSGETYVVMLEEWADLLARQRRWSEADSTYREALAVLQEDAAPDAQQLASVRIGLGLALVEQRAWDEAEAHLLAGYQALAAQSEEPEPRQRAALEALVRLYTAQERMAEAAAYRALLPEALPTAMTETPDS